MHKKYDKDRLVLFDVGANVGNYSRDLHSVFGENVDIYSFEPLDSTYNVLCDNVKSYSNVHCHNIGLSDQKQKLTIYTNKECSGLSSVYKRRLDYLNIKMSIMHECCFTTIDDFCESNGLEHIHFIKMDVEGHEISVLKGAQKKFAENKIDFIQFEFGGCNIDSRTFFQDFWYILHEKYNIYKITSHGLYPIREYRATLEVFLTQNFLAELK